MAEAAAAPQFPEGYTVEKLRTMFHDAQNASSSNRTEAELDRDYYDHKQYTDAEKATLNERKQPVVTENLIQRKINRLLGQEIVSRTDPKAWPRNIPDEKAAEVATDTLRFIMDRAQFNKTVVKVAKNIAIEGFGGAELSCVTERNQKEIDINYIPWDRTFYDPRSAEPDFSDARYKGTLQWKDAPDAAALFNVPEDELTPGTGLGEDTTYQDKPENFSWSDSKANRIMIVYIYYQVAGEWWFCIFSNTKVLKAGQSPYRYDNGKSMCPLQLTSVYVDRDNNRYGEVRGMRSLQDETNKRRSKLLHMLSVRQVKYVPGSLEDDVEVVRRELARPDGVVKVHDKDGLEIIPVTDMIAGQFNLLTDTRHSLDNVSVQHSLQGRGLDNQSGRAILAQQQGALSEIAFFLDAVRDFKQRVAHCAWSMAKQFFDGPRMIRITDDEEAPKYVQLNAPTGQLGPNGQPAVAAVDPATKQVLFQGAFSELDVDIVIDQAPDSAVIQQEQYQGLVDLAKSGIPIPPDAIIEASSLRNKKAILDKMNGANDPEAQQKKQQEMMLMVRKAVADIMETEANAQLKQAQAAKAMSEANAPQAGPEQPMPLEMEKTFAEIEGINAKSELTAAQAFKTWQEANMIPAEFAHQVESSDADRQIAVRQQQARQASPA